MASNHDVMQLLTVLLHDFKVSVSQQIETLLEKIESYEIKRHHTEEAISKISLDLQKQQQEIAQLKMRYQQFPNTAVNPILPKSGLNQATHLNITENHSIQFSSERGIRRNNIILTGLEAEGYDPKIVIENFLSTHFLTRNDAVLAVQKLNSSTSTRYLVTLKSVWDAQSIYSQRVQKLRNKNIYISEDLNQKEASLFYKARCLKKGNFIQSTWTKDGRTFIRESDTQDAVELHLSHPLLKHLAPSNISTILPTSSTSQNNTPIPISTPVQLIPIQVPAPSEISPPIPLRLVPIQLPTCTIPSTETNSDSDDNELLNLLEAAVASRSTRTRSKRKEKKKENSPK